MTDTHSAAIELLTDGFGRVRQVAHGAVDGLAEADLTVRLDSEANTIAWLIWHLARVQDDHIADVAGEPQVWTSEGWSERLGLERADSSIGYGDSSEQVGAVRAPAELLLGYLDAVHERSLRYVASLADEDLARVVDTRWDPPVTLSVRLVSVISDDLQHAGQAMFIRGCLLRR
jgi:uncharacterized damage-inducible protein DinB